MRSTDAQRRRLAAKAKTLGRRVLRDIATIVTPDTLLAWHTINGSVADRWAQCETGEWRDATMA